MQWRKRNKAKKSRVDWNGNVYCYNSRFVYCIKTANKEFIILSCTKVLQTKLKVSIIQTLIRSKLHPSIRHLQEISKFIKLLEYQVNRKTVTVPVKLTLKLNEKGFREPSDTCFNFSSTVFCSIVGISASCSIETLQEKAKTCGNGFFDNLKKDRHQDCRYEKYGGFYFMRAWYLNRGYSYMLLIWCGRHTVSKNWKFYL